MRGCPRTVISFTADLFMSHRRPRAGLRVDEVGLVEHVRIPVRERHHALGKISFAGCAGDFKTIGVAMSGYDRRAAALFGPGFERR
jgi:hypothetical protein